MSRLCAMLENASRYGQIMGMFVLAVLVGHLLGIGKVSAAEFPNLESWFRAAGNFLKSL